MASTLVDGQAPDRVLDKGHGPGALGPSDTTDSGSDIATDAPANRDILPDHIENIADMADDSETEETESEQRE